MKLFLLSCLSLTLALSSCKKEDDDSGGGDLDPKVGIQGTWQSSGSDVAPLLVTLFGTDSIYADFRTDFTYTVEQYDSTGAKLTLSGVYTQEKSNVGDIYEIEVNQSTPAALVSEGIFEVIGSTMRYEIVQTSPDIGATPPTPADGFGSTNGGAFGNLNVQVYQEVK